MYDINFICSIIKEYNREDRGFVIYPFGKDGLYIKNILIEYFNIEPCYIVDNEYCKCSDKIISGAEFRDKFSKSMYIIIATANPWINDAIVEELLEYVPLDNIINFEQILNEKKMGFQIDSFLPDTNIIKTKTNSRDRIKVRFLHNGANTWNVISSVCEGFKEDPLFDVLIIIDKDPTT